MNLNNLYYFTKGECQDYVPAYKIKIGATFKHLGSDFVYKRLNKKFKNYPGFETTQSWTAYKSVVKKL